MNTLRLTDRIRQGLPAVLAGVLFMLQLCLPAAPEAARLMEAEQLDGNLAKVTGKAPNGIVIDGHSLGSDARFVLVTKTSRIYDLDNTVLELADLKLPCVAEISFYRDAASVDPELTTLRVKEYSPRARARFTMKKPAVRRPE